MNKRIEKLILQAGTTGNHQVWFTRPEMKKLAELIVKECMTQVEDQYKPVTEDKEMMKDTHWDGYVQCGVDSYIAIREHFDIS
jgi:hypothetical protein